MKVIEKTLMFEQDKDCCDGVSPYSQILTVQTQDGGGGNFIVLSTERWALADDKEIDEFCAALKNVLKGMD